MAGSDYQVVKLAVMGEVKSQFRPEFVNRIDKWALMKFPRTGGRTTSAQSRASGEGAQARLAKMDYGFDVSEAAIAELAKTGFDPVYGARPLKRAIQAEIENPLAKAILEGRFAPKDTIRADYRAGRMTFEKSPAKAAA
jgi:ATP-dependent Clp protease ATP-binding subunit ClpB